MSVRDPVPLGPFSEWCQDRLDHYGSRVATARACGVDARQFGRWVRGDASNPEGVICVGRVDEVLVAEGSTLLEELYPLEVQV